MFFRGVDSKFNVTQELALVHSMHGTTTGEDIFKELEKSLLECKLDWSKLKCVTIDGGKNMSGVKKGLVGQITRRMESSGLSKPMFLHCIIHQQALCVKYVDMTCVLKPVVETINYIRSHGLIHRQVRGFLKETDSEIIDLPSYTAVKWLSCGKVLSCFFQLREEIKLFLLQKNHHVPVLYNTDWLMKLAFFVDLISHVNQLNISMQRENNLISDVFSLVKTFRSKLLLLGRNVQHQNLEHLPTGAKLRAESGAAFPSSFAAEKVRELHKQFTERFSDLDAHTEEIKMFQNPFDCDVNRLPGRFQMEIIELQSNDLLRAKHKEGDLAQFYKSLQPEKFPNLKEFARGSLSIFGTTYLCKQIFSRMKYVKSKYRSTLTDEHLKSLLIIGSSKLVPDYNELLRSTAPPLSL
ncbi:general transcription factor II-I repeat domain-containing protein 2A-like [Tiliqua scincoides]|uniref:general transcription factor II-I repeat domain-containing protein 2A-like n=1 Tax=Tiliqua scincoides TaxID=71010 RepID=UPI003462731B